MSDHDEKGHHIIAPKIVVLAGLVLVVLTVLTVVVSRIDLGALNQILAMIIATAKALLVLLVFMGLLWDGFENRLILFASLLFSAIFFILTSIDVFFRAPVKVNEEAFAAKNAESKFEKAWISNAELIAHGKKLYESQCVSCHGSNGMGDGAAAAALNPKPRNFHESAGWKIGRKPSQVFWTLTNGLEGGAMASFGTLSTDDRWGLVHYVLSLGEKAPEDSEEDLKKIGIDPSGATTQSKSVTLPIDFVIERMSKGV